MTEMPPHGGSQPRSKRDEVTLVDTYNATEGGVYAASDFSGARGMLVLPHRGTFFEFVPIDERDRSSPSRVPLWEVEKDRPYSIVVTTVRVARPAPTPG